MDKNIEIKNKFIELIDQILNINNNEHIILFKENIDDTQILNIIESFCNKIDKNNDIFKLLLKKNYKLFNNKNGIILIDNFNLKVFLEKNKNNEIWESIQLLYAINRAGNDKCKQKVDKIITSIENNKVSNSLNTDNMILDIAKTLRNNIVDSSKNNNNKVNPIENMLKTSEDISKKYAEKLKNNNININDMFNSLSRVMNQIDLDTTNDDELKNVDMDEFNDPKKMISDLGIDIPENFNPLDIINQFMDNNKNNQKLSSKQIKEMEDFYSNINTDDIKL
jgi:hypothetical protein|tara:strand:- start:2172 stop:3011 length:840 start_codon:yes stop_codon:yes gene_type:complete